MKLMILLLLSQLIKTHYLQVNVNENRSNWSGFFLIIQPTPQGSKPFEGYLNENRPKWSDFFFLSC